MRARAVTDPRSATLRARAVTYPEEISFFNTILIDHDDKYQTCALPAALQQVWLLLARGPGASTLALSMCAAAGARDPFRRAFGHGHWGLGCGH